MGEGRDLSLLIPCPPRAGLGYWGVSTAWGWGLLLLWGHQVRLQIHTGPVSQQSCPHQRQRSGPYSSVPSSRAVSGGFCRVPAAPDGSGGSCRVPAGSAVSPQHPMAPAVLSVPARVPGHRGQVAAGGAGAGGDPRAPALPPGREAPLSSPPGAHWAGAEGPARVGGGNARGAEERRRLRGSATGTGESRRDPPGARHGRGGSARPGGLGRIPGGMGVPEERGSVPQRGEKGSAGRAGGAEPGERGWGCGSIPGSVRVPASLRDSRVPTAPWGQPCPCFLPGNPCPYGPPKPAAPGGSGSLPVAVSPCRRGSPGSATAPSAVSPSPCPPPCSCPSPWPCPFPWPCPSPSCREQPEVSGTENPSPAAGAEPLREGLAPRAQGQVWSRGFTCRSRPGCLEKCCVPGEPSHPRQGLDSRIFSQPEPIPPAAVSWSFSLGSVGRAHLSLGLCVPSAAGAGEARAEFGEFRRILGMVLAGGTGIPRLTGARQTRRVC